MRSTYQLIVMMQGETLFDKIVDGPEPLVGDVLNLTTLSETSSKENKAAFYMVKTRVVEVGHYTRFSTAGSKLFVFVERYTMVDG